MDVSHLKTIPLFSSLNDEELTAIAPFAEEVDVEEGTVLVKEGQYSYEFIAIREGTAEVTRAGEHVASLGPGDFFGEIGLLITPKRTASVRARTALEVVVLDHNQFSEMVKASQTSDAAVRRTARTRLARKPVPASKQKKPRT